MEHLVDPPAAPRPVVLSVEGLTKSFGVVRALTDVSLDVRAGEVLALMGENGAGKSTVLKLLSGDERPDSGVIRIEGEAHSATTPKETRDAGIRVAYQETEIIPGITVAENLFLGELPTRGSFVNWRRLRAMARAALRDVGVADLVPIERLGAELTPAQRQLVEITRALKPGLKVLALDEPTSSLTDDEVNRLFTIVRRLRDEGVAIIYVSHRMKEIFRIADRVAVLRDGRLVGVKDAGDTDENELVRMMVGRQLEAMYSRNRNVPGAPVLTVEHVSSSIHDDVSFEIRAGEVVGFGGLIGAGRTELAQLIFGNLRPTAGTVTINGTVLHAWQPRDAIAAGIGLAPEDRKGEGLVLEQSVRENVSVAVLRRLCRLRFVNRRAERRLVERYTRELNVRTPSINQSVRKLSGGNQQKVVLAKWLATSPSLLILDEPTRGIDVGAKAEIYRIIDTLAGEGVAILLISSELPELLGIADRIIVMQDGHITGEMAAADATEDRLLALAMKTELTAEPA